MKITIDEMWQSVNRLMFPESGPFTAQDCGYAIPEALKQCAVVMVRDTPFGEHYYQNPNRWAQDQQNVIDGLRELKHNGFLTFKQD